MRAPSGPPTSAPAPRTANSISATKTSTPCVRVPNSPPPCAKTSTGSASPGTPSSGNPTASPSTRRDLAHSTQAPHEDDDEPLYNNHCRPLLPTPLGSVILSGARSADSKDPGGPHLAPTAGTVFTLLPNTNYRLRTPDHQPIAFTDLHAGPQSFTPAVDFGDFLIWRKPLTSDPNDIGLPSYQLACAVDDALTHITEVVRGRDLLKSTARQILLQRALGYPTPAYFHCDLLCDASGLRLAKRHDALSLRALRASGLIPSQVLAMG